MKKSENPTIFIGIGGTGEKVSDVLKKKTREKMEVSLEGKIHFLESDSDVDENVELF